MSKESKTLEKDAQAKAAAKQPWTAQRVGDLILNNAGSGLAGSGR